MSSPITEERRAGSQIRRIPHPNNNDDTIRVGRLVSLQGISSTQEDGSRPIDKTFFYNSVAAFLAYKHFNERRGDVVPWLPNVLKECDFYFTYEFRDTQWSGIEAVRQLALATDSLRTSNNNNNPSSGRVTETAESEESESGVLSASAAPTEAPTTTPRTDDPIRTLPPRSTGPPKADNDARRANRKRARNLQGTTATAAPSSNDYWNKTSTTVSLPNTQQSASVSPLLPSDLNLDPFATYGAYWSSSTKLLSILSGGLGLPHVSGASTSAELETSSPFFARTVASNDGDARAAILYYQDIGVTHLACVFIKDSWGINYHASLQKYANRAGIYFKSFPYDKCCVGSAISDLAQSQYRHVYAIMHNWKIVLGKAYRQGIIGNKHYSWMGAEEKKWTGDAFAVDKKTEADLARALHGIGTLNIYFETVPAFEEALEEMAFNPLLQQEYISTLADPSTFDGYGFPRYDPTGFTNSIFDGVLSLGLAACQTTEPLFTGEELYDTLVHNVAFEGVSGQVAFDPSNGNRKQEGMRYSVEYVLLSDERTTEDEFRFESRLATVVGGDRIFQHVPFVYHDNTTNVPPPLPPLEDIELNLVSTGTQALGYVMAGIVISTSIGFWAWVLKHRNIFVVRASQPIFLGQLCAGTLVMALAVFPASLPGASTSVGPDAAMDAACTSQLWLAFLGFATAFSAICSKTNRLNRLMNSGHRMRRIKVNARDVMGPFFALMAINVTMLLCITFASPYRYERVEVESYDPFGRSTESFGTCRPANNFFYLFLTIMACSNGMGVLMALYQAWKARNLPIEMSESYYLGLSLASFTETLCLGGPILLVTYNQPTAWYLLSSAILCIGCMTILLPIMLPKYAARHAQVRAIAVQGGGGSQSGRSGRGSIAFSRVGSVHISGLVSDPNGSSTNFGGSVRMGDGSATFNRPASLGRGKLAIHRNDSHTSRGGSMRGGGSNNSPWGSRPPSRRGSHLRSHTVIGTSTNPSTAEGGSRSTSRRNSRRASRNFYGGIMSQGHDSASMGGSDRLTPTKRPSHKSGWDGSERQVRLTIEQSIQRLQELSGIEMSSSSEEEDSERNGSIGSFGRSHSPLNVREGGNENGKETSSEQDGFECEPMSRSLEVSKGGGRACLDASQEASDVSEDRFECETSPS